MLSPLLAATPIDWQQTTLESLSTIEQELVENHPGAIDTESDNFKTWISTAKKLIPEKLPQVTSQYSYQQLLRWYTRGFNDGHLSVSFDQSLQTQKCSWPGLLATYDPKTQEFLLTEKVDPLVQKNPGSHGHAFDYFILKKINGQDVKQWIDKNCTPFYGGPILGCESAYIKMAPWALAHTDNPFAEKPTTITVRARASCRCLDGAKERVKTISLPERSIPYKILCEKVSSTRGFDKNQHAFVQFFVKNPRARMIQPQHCYVRIPTLAPQNTSEQQALEAVIARLTQARHCASVIFDIRGCYGGSSEYAHALLRSLFGSEYVEQQLLSANSAEYVEWRATPGNIDYLKRTSLEGHPLLKISQEAKNWFAGMARKLQSAHTAGLPFFKETAQAISPTNRVQPLTQARVTFIIDAQNASAALDFIDYAKALTNVKLLGHPTSADSVNMEVRTETFGSGKTAFTLNFPIKVFRGRTRGHNQPYIPDTLLDAEKMKSFPKNNSDSCRIFWFGKINV